MMQNESTKPQQAPYTGAADTSVPDQRTQLAAIRTTLALDRTLLAWVRTALSLMAGGIAFDQGARLLHESRLKAGTALMQSGHAIGIGVTVMSTALIATAAWVYRRDLRTVAAMLQRPSPRISSSLIAAVLVTILGILGTAVLIATGD